MTKKKKPISKSNAVQRSYARGGGARGTTGFSDNGRDAIKGFKQSTKGNYKIAFTEVYERMTEKDLELREVYAKDLISNYVGVPADMISLKLKKQGDNQTLTSKDEVFYVKVGKEVYGKISIRTQWLLRSTSLIFLYQEKHKNTQVQKTFQGKGPYHKKTKSQISEAKRKYKRKRGTT